MSDGRSSEIHRLAMEKTARVLGQARAEALLARLLREHSISLDSADDLMRLSEVMAKLGGFEAAVGAMLGVAAALRGANGRSR